MLLCRWNLDSRCLTFQEHHVDLLWTEKFLEDTRSNLGVKRFARKDIEIDIIGLFDEMSRDTGGLDELDECVTLCMSCTEFDDTGLSVGDHVDIPYEFLGEFGNCLFAT